MKKLLVFILCLFFLAGCSNGIEYDQPQGTIADMSGYTGLQTEQFISATIEDVIQMAKDEKTTIIYFGYDECPWCNALVPVLNEVSIDKDMKVYYVDYHDEANYNNVEQLEALQQLCIDFLTTDEDGELIFYFPTIIYMQKGTVIDIHVATVSGHDATQSALTEKQRARLVYLLSKEFDSVLKK